MSHAGLKKLIEQWVYDHPNDTDLIIEIVEGKVTIRAWEKSSLFIHHLNKVSIGHSSQLRARIIRSINYRLGDLITEHRKNGKPFPQIDCSTITIEQFIKVFPTKRSFLGSYSNLGIKSLDLIKAAINDAGESLPW